jgi:CheY-like chemotaxis protein
MTTRTRCTCCASSSKRLAPTSPLSVRRSWHCQRIVEIKPQVLVVDLGMPEMDGFEVIRRVRASIDPAIRNVPAAALTAFARSEDRTKALRTGFQMHLAKPVDPGELVASVATLARRVSSGS